MFFKLIVVVIVTAIIVIITVIIVIVIITISFSNYFTIYDCYILHKLNFNLPFYFYFFTLLLPKHQHPDNTHYT